MTRDEAVTAVRHLLDDGQRIDRYLRKSEDGSYYTTDAERYDGDHDCADHYIRVTWIDGGTELTDEEYEAEAEAIVQRLDDHIADCDECN